MIIIYEKLLVYLVNIHIGELCAGHVYVCGHQPARLSLEQWCGEYRNLQVLAPHPYAQENSFLLLSQPLGNLAKIPLSGVDHTDTLYILGLKP